ncbi:MAG: coenzyme F430 synthase [Candidatus Methanospirare jalkutatii]|nr:coenzyme F430 synthase [Candidatus Methanospirare jalkutatii]
MQAAQEAQAQEQEGQELKGHEVQAVQAVEAGSSIESAERILVLDTIHGGSILVEELRLLGKEAFGLNPYRTTSPPAHDFDLVISPVHLNPALREAVLRELRGSPEVISHHDAVREIVQATSLLEGVRAVEVTGTTAKTTVCELLCQMLRGKSVLSLTSAGTRFSDGKKEVSLTRLSITPASILKALRLASESGLNAEFAVFEVSLGLTGVGSVGVLTSLSEDYAIAGGTSSASNAKKASLRNFKGILVVPSSCDVSAPAARAVNIVSKDLYLRGDVAFFHLNTLLNSEKHASHDIAPSSAKCRIEGHVRLCLNFCDCAFYRKCVEIALTAALSLGVPPEELNTSLQAVPARLSVVEWRRRVLVDNSNSGTKLQFLGEALALAERFKCQKRGQEKVLIVGEEARYVCEGVGVDELRKIVEAKHAEFTKIIVVGDDFSDVFPYENVIISKSLQEALEEAVKSTGEGAIIVSMVKTWR